VTEGPIRVITIAERGQTVLEPATIGVALILIAMIVALPRHRAILPLIIGMAMIPIAQRLVVASLDFNMVRMLLFVGWLRIFARGEQRFLRPLHNVDKAFLWWALASFLFFMADHLSMNSLAYKLGASLDMVGGYLLCRVFVRSEKDMDFVAISLMIVLGILGPMLWAELEWGKNLFHSLGARENVVYSAHSDRYRARGPFSHPIMAGCFGAVLVPLVLGFGFRQRKFLVPVLISVAAAFMGVIGANSSGAFFSLLGGLGAWGLWILRRHIGLIWRSAFVIMFVAHFAMSKPIWHLYVRMASITGGSGYHRYNLVNAFVNHFTDWALVGSKNAASWGWGLQDITNQWVLEGVNGGLVTLILFNYLLFTLFKEIGTRIRLARARNALPRATAKRLEILGWSAGACIAANVTAFTSVSYFGQLNVAWYFSVAIAASYTALPQFQFAPPGPGRAKQKTTKPNSIAPKSDEAQKSKSSPRPDMLVDLLGR